MDLTDKQVTVIKALAGEEEITAGELATKIGKRRKPANRPTAHAVRHTVTRLSYGAYVKKRVLKDRRGKPIGYALTATGRRLLERL